MEVLHDAVGQVAGPEIPGRQAEVPALGRSCTSVCCAAQGFHALVSLAAQKRWNIQQFFLQTVAR